MKRTLTAALALILLLTGCGAKKKIDPTPTEAPEENLVTVTEDTTAPPRPIAERAASLQAAGDTYIFDEQSVLSDEEKKQYNDYLGWLCKSRQIKAAVVITNELDGSAPDAFAKRYFETLFGENTTGFLVLVNNDTNRDCIYRAGGCKASLPDPDAVIAQATPLLVEQHYADALEILLSLGETLPEHILDLCGVLTAEQVQTLSALAEASGNTASVLLIGKPAEISAEPTETDTAEAPAETEPVSEDESETEPESETAPETEAPSREVPDELKARAESALADTGVETLLVIDTENKTAWIAGKDTAKLDAVQNALDTAGIYEAALRLYDAPSEEN